MAPSGLPDGAAAPSPLRRALDALYDAAAALAALCVVALLVAVLLSILGRRLHFNIPGIDAYAGYLMASAGFLALAHTLKRGEHIRVTLLVNALRGRPRRAVEAWALFATSLLGALAAFYACRLAWQSYRFNDVSTASDATPLWIPQLSMAAGCTVLAVALVDELVLEWHGLRRREVPEEALHNE